MNPELQQAWTEYLAMEERGQRRALLAALESFVAQLEAAPTRGKTEFAFELAAEVVDRRSGIPIRHPLFGRIIGPRLVAGIEEELPGCARWLAGLSHSLCKFPTLLKKLGEDASEIALLTQALRHDPTDAASRARLIDAEANYLRYTLHELPVGVLFDGNGASVEECDELVETLSRFEGLVEDAGVLKDHARSVNELSASARPTGS